MTAAATGGRALQMARASYGLALVLAPRETIRLAAGRLPGRRECTVARLLGARHLVQAALTVVIPLPGVFAIGAQVDTVHAASMLMLAAAGRPERRAVLTDALTEAIFAAAGFSASAQGLSAPARGLSGKYRPSATSDLDELARLQSRLCSALAPQHT
jgi:hypothetical protein